MTVKIPSGVFDRADRLGLKVCGWNPGDGTRLRFFLKDDPSDFHGPSNGLGTVYNERHLTTIELAHAWLDGYSAALTGMGVSHV